MSIHSLICVGLPPRGLSLIFFSLVANVKYAGPINLEVPFLSGYYSDTLVFDEGLNIFLFPTQI